MLVFPSIKDLLPEPCGTAVARVIFEPVCNMCIVDVQKNFSNCKEQAGSIVWIGLAIMAIVGDAKE